MANDLREMKSDAFFKLKRLCLYYLAASVLVYGKKHGNHSDFIKYLDSFRDKMMGWIMEVYQEMEGCFPNAILENVWVRYRPQEAAPLRIELDFDNDETRILMFGVNEEEIRCAIEMFLAEQNIPELLKEAHSQLTFEEVRSKLDTASWPVQYS